MKHKKVIPKTGQLLSSSPRASKWTPSVHHIFSNRNVHAMKHDEGWAIRREGRDHASAVYRTKEEAINKARAIARREGVDLVVHGRDGRIKERNTYGDTPHSRRR